MLLIEYTIDLMSFFSGNKVEFCVKFPIWENLVTKSTKVALLGKFK